ncbi:MAG: hypothetical protein Kapaf2KO_13910 [Candidatus Kapaibacteriales bacterium]
MHTTFNRLIAWIITVIVFGLFIQHETLSQSILESRFNTFSASLNKLIRTNPAAISTYNPVYQILDSTDQNSLIIDSYIQSGYLGFDNINPGNIGAIYSIDELAFGLSVNGLSNELVSRFSGSLATAYQITEDASLGASYTFSTFKPKGFEGYNSSSLNLSYSQDFGKESTVFFTLNDVFDTSNPERDTVTQFSSTRRLVAGYQFQSNWLLASLDFHASESNAGVIPTFGVLPIESIYLFLSGESSTRSIIVGTRVTYLGVIFGIRTILSDYTGNQTGISLGYRF